jgi:hypothetical protein
VTGPGDGAAVGDWLRSAVERVVPVGTKDVDVLIDGSDWTKVDSALESKKDVAPLEPTSGSLRGIVLRIGDARIDLEFISGEPFSGTSAPDSFGRYVRTEGSTVHDGIRYATPAVVFYMRLNAPDDWQVYLPAIERDIAAGVLGRTLDEAARVADRFGIGPEIRTRIKSLRTMLRGMDPLRE